MLGSRLDEAERLLTEGNITGTVRNFFNSKHSLPLREGNFKLAAQHVHRG